MTSKTRRNRKSTGVAGAMLTVLFAGVLCLSQSARAQDTLLLVTNPSSQLTGDTASWKQLGADQKLLASSFNVNSAAGTSIGVGLTGANSIASVVCGSTPANCSWTGGLGGSTAMNAGDTVLSASDAAAGGNGPLTLNFPEDIAGAGALIQADAPGQFTAQIQVFDSSGTLLGTVSNTSDSAGDPLYIGVIDQTEPNIAMLTFSITSCGTTDTSNCTDFGLDSVNITLPDYTLNILNPVLFAQVGQNVTFNGSLGFATSYGDPVNVSCGSGAPSTCAPVSSPVIPSSGGTSFSVTAGSSTVGDFNFNVIGVGTDARMVTHSQAVALHVFNLSLSSAVPASVNVAQGNPTAPVSFTVSTQGSVPPVTLSCSGLPAGASCQFYPSNVVQIASGQSLKATVVVDSGSAATGSSTVTINATPAGASAQSQAFGLTIVAGSGSADLTVAASGSSGGSQVVMVGGTGLLTANITVVGGGSLPSTVNAYIAFSGPVRINILDPQFSSGNCVGTASGSGKNGSAGFYITANITGTCTTDTIKIPFVAGFARNITGTVTVSSSATDPNPNNNTGTAIFQVRPRPFARKGLQPILP